MPGQQAPTQAPCAPHLLADGCLAQHRQALLVDDLHHTWHTIGLKVHLTLAAVLQLTSCLQLDVRAHTLMQ